MDENSIRRKFTALLRLLLRRVRRYLAFLRSVPGIDGVCTKIDHLMNLWCNISTIKDINKGWLPTISKLSEIYYYEGAQGIRLYRKNIEEQLIQPRFDKYYRDAYTFKDDEFIQQPGKICICVHLDHGEMPDGIISYLSNMPFEYDLHISVTDINHEQKIRGELNKLIKIQNYKISVMPYHWKNAVPLFVAFASIIRKYDYVCHIHTYDSSRADEGNIHGRDHLLFNLLGPDKNINRVFQLFREHPEVGLIYPEPSPDIPYWEYTWLSYAGPVNALLGRLGMHTSVSGYLDFPAGLMFWAKVKAIDPLLRLMSSHNKLFKRTGLIDGTLVPVLERALVPTVKSRGMTFIETDLEKNAYRINCGSKNLWQYWDKSSEELYGILDNYEIVSFDIFDTLITRPVLTPDAAFQIAGIKVNKALNLNIDFAGQRKQAEFRIRVRNNFIGDCSIDDIYVEFQSLTNLSGSDCETIKQIEIQNETDLCIPRREMVEIFNLVKSKGKRTILISDIYLRRQDVEAILLKCGVGGYDEIMLSSMINKRKDTGELWDYYKNHINNARCLHIGDNEYSDIQVPMGKGLDCYHVMSGRNIFYNTRIGQKICEKLNDDIQNGDSAAIGTLIAKEFNSPFALHAAAGGYAINDLRTMGYVIFGPMFITFISWLVRNVKDDDRDMLLFLSREGYFLEKIYNKYFECLRRSDGALNKVNSTYFLASRRAASFAAIYKDEDILDVLEAPYKGSVSYLLSSRFGINSDNNEMVSLPEDFDKLKDIAVLYKGEILENAALERENYLRYCRELGLLRYDKIGIVDLGYSGSMQYYLSKIIGKPTVGYYFMTRSDQLKGNRYEGNLMKDCFQFIDKDTNRINTIYAFILIFESLLTSPDGQFMKFSLEGRVLKPVFGEPSRSQKVFGSLNLVYEGILNYIEDMVRAHGSCLLDLTFTQRTTQIILEYIMLNSNFISDEIKGIFSVEDKYCSDIEISIFDYYRKNFGIME